MKKRRGKVLKTGIVKKQRTDDSVEVIINQEKCVIVYIKLMFSTYLNFANLLICCNYIFKVNSIYNSFQHTIFEC